MICLQLNRAIAGIYCMQKHSPVVFFLLNWPFIIKTNFSNIEFVLQRVIFKQKFCKNNCFLLVHIAATDEGKILF